MEEALLQEWSEVLASLRAKRSEELSRRQHEKVDFSPAEFFDVAVKSLDEILDQWLSFETRSLAGRTPEVDQLRTELDGVFDFEIDSISRDMSTIRSGAHWDDTDVEMALGKFEAATQELKKKYVLKTSGLNAPSAKKRVMEEPVQPQRMHSGGSGGGSAVSVVGMFLLGLVLGAGPSVYFWNQAKEQEVAHQDERSKMLSEQRALEDSMTMLHERFDDLATGKILSIPEIDRQIDKIRKDVAAKKAAVEADYNRQRERLMKRTPAGAKLDQALAKITEARNQQASALEAQEAQAVEPLEKQKNTLQELRVH